MRDEELFVGIVTCIAMGLNFGMWMQDLNAGFSAGLATWIAYRFRYDKD